VATRKSQKLEGFKLLAVRGVDPQGKPEKDYVIALDAVGAGAGEIVLTVTGSSAREDAKTKKAATDTTIIAIVDRVTLGPA
jgi:ethanolamine utilization protein EutN